MARWPNQRRGCRCSNPYLCRTKCTTGICTWNSALYAISLEGAIYCEPGLVLRCRVGVFTSSRQGVYAPPFYYILSFLPVSPSLSPQPLSHFSFSLSLPPPIFLTRVRSFFILCSSCLYRAIQSRYTCQQPPFFHSGSTLHYRFIPRSTVSLSTVYTRILSISRAIRCYLVRIVLPVSTLIER